MKKPLQSQNILISESRNSFSVICMLAWPVVLEQIFMTLVGYIDTAMVGSLGTNASASIGVIAPFNWMLGGLMSALGVGFSVMTGHAYGAGDFESAKRVVRQGVISALCFGALVTMLVQLLAAAIPVWMNADPAIRSDSSAYFRIYGAAYIFVALSSMSSAILRCSGDTKTPFLCNAAANIINIVLNFLLIYSPRTITIFGVSFQMWGAGMGVRGAALASAASLGLTSIILFSRLFIKKYPIRISIRDRFKPDGKILSSVLRLASPIALEKITENLGQIMMTALVTGIGTAQLAAHNFAITAESMTYMPAFGFSAAATTLVAQSLGAKKQKLALKYADQCVFIGIVFMSMMGLLLFFIPHELIDIFSNDPEVIDIGGQVLRIEAFAQPFFAMQMVASGALRGGGDTKMPFLYSMLGMWGVRVGLALILIKGFNLGLTGAWIAMVANISFSGLLIFIRMRRRKWLGLHSLGITGAESGKATETV